MDDPLETNDEIEDTPIVQPVEKKKRVLTPAQLESLRKGREKGLNMIRNKGQINRQIKEEQEKIKQIKKDEKINTVQELKEITDLAYLRRKMEGLEVKFDGYLNEKQERRKLKEQNNIEKTVKKELPRAVNDIMLQQKIADEMKNNIFYNRI